MFEHLKKVRDARGFSCTEKIVLFALASRANEENQAWPSTSTLLRDTSIKKKDTLFDAVKRLEAAGAIHVKRSVGRGNRNIYTLLANLSVPSCKQCRNWDYKPTENVPDDDEEIVPKMVRNGAENGTIYDTEEIVPFLEKNSPKNGKKIVPKMGPEAKREDKKEVKIHPPLPPPTGGCAKIAMWKKIGLNPAKKTAASQDQKTMPGETPKRKPFIPPTLEEVSQYANEPGRMDFAQEFHDYYQSVNWYRGKIKMIDWRATYRTWENKRKGSAHHAFHPQPAYTKRNLKPDNWLPPPQDQEDFFLTQAQEIYNSAHATGKTNQQETQT